MLAKIFKKIFQHKFITIMVLALLVFGFYFGNKAINGNGGELRYALAQVERGTLIFSVSGSGQIAVMDQVDIKPKVSGNLVAIYINKDQSVKGGQLIATLDSKDTERSVRDAQTVLDKAQRDLADAKENYQEIEIDAENSLRTAYEDGYSSVSTSFFKLSDYIKDLKDAIGTDQSSQEYITGYELVLGRDSLFIQKFLDDYYKANDLFNKNFAFFRTVFQDGDRDTIYKLISDTIDTTKAISQALESARHMYDAAVINESYKKLTIASQIDKMQPKIESDVSSVYSSISSIQRIKDTIDDTNKNTPKNIENARLAAESAQNSVTQKEEALFDAKEKLDEYNIRAPFSGSIASINDKIKIGDSVSSGTMLATLITRQKIAQISLNEIDAAKVKAGQKVTLTFDALPDTSITGKVAEVDTMGTASQGVVSYGVKIVLDSGEDAIKPGYSVVADIITDVKQDVLVLPNGAIKSQGDSYYVELVDVNADSQFTQQLLANVSGTILPEPPNTQQVEVGLANDVSTEIVSGLKEGDIVVVSTINPNQTQTASQTQRTQSFQMPGMTGGSGQIRSFR
ncbi:MAG: HlyD family efflux transporter periplasmic adaptor subunit [Candidatus Nealsonbacteria bacterium]|nr:HlyD family efflux transporter periplasmic adaptor subunit [Candidatus Nealsonbacteria bacterium]